MPKVISICQWIVVVAALVPSHAAAAPVGDWADLRNKSSIAAHWDDDDTSHQSLIRRIPGGFSESCN